MSARRNALLLVALAGVGFAAWLAIGRDSAAGVKVTAVSLQSGRLASEAFGIGTVEARRSYAIGPTMASRMARVIVDQGDRVRAGQLLAELDPVDLDDRAASAANALRRAANLTDAAAAQVREARSRAALATASAARYQDLLQKSFVSRDALEIKQHEANAAAAAVAAADASHQAALREQSRLQAECAAIGKLRAQYRLVSPVDGIVLSREVEPGTTMVAGQIAIRLIDPSSLWVRARIDQGRAGGLAPGLPASIALRSLPGEPLPGNVARIELASDSVAEERIVDIAFERIPPGLSPGETAEVSIKLPARDGLLAPSAAVRRVDGSAAVLRIRGGRAEPVPVRIERESPDGRTQILGGVRDGEQVVQYAATELKGGEQVRVVESLGR